LHADRSATGGHDSFDRDLAEHLFTVSRQSDQYLKDLDCVARDNKFAAELAKWYATRNSVGVRDQKPVQPAAVTMAVSSSASAVFSWAWLVLSSFPDYYLAHVHKPFVG